MRIGEDTIQEVVNQVDGLLNDYRKEINEAFLKARGALDVALSVKISPDGDGLLVETGINFVKDRIKAKASGTVIEGQMKLDLEGPRETDEPARFCPVKGERVRESFCNSSCHLQLEILVPDGTIPIPTAPVIPADESVFVQFRPCAAWADDITQANVHKMLLWEPPPTEAADPPALAEVEQSGEGMMNEGAYPVVDAEWPTEEGTTDEGAVGATYSPPGFVGVRLSREEYKAVNVAYSGDILGDGKAKNPFSYYGEQRITQSMLHSPVPGESYADTWRLVPPKEFEGEIFSHDEIRAQYEDGSRNRGDLTGMVVTCQGQQYVLDFPLRFYPWITLRFPATAAATIGAGETRRRASRFQGSTESASARVASARECFREPRRRHESPGSPRPLASDPGPRCWEDVLPDFTKGSGML